MVKKWYFNGRFQKWQKRHPKSGIKVVCFFEFCETLKNPILKNWSRKSTCFFRWSKNGLEKQMWFLGAPHVTPAPADSWASAWAWPPAGTLGLRSFTSHPWPYPAGFGPTSLPPGPMVAKTQPSPQHTCATTLYECSYDVSCAHGRTHVFSGPQHLSE